MLNIYWTDKMWAKTFWDHFEFQIKIQTENKSAPLMKSKGRNRTWGSCKWRWPISGTHGSPRRFTTWRSKSIENLGHSNRRCRECEWHGIWHTMTWHTRDMAWHGIGMPCQDMDRTRMDKHKDMCHRLTADTYKRSHEDWEFGIGCLNDSTIQIVWNRQSSTFHWFSPFATEKQGHDSQFR